MTYREKPLVLGYSSDAVVQHLADRKEELDFLFLEEVQGTDFRNDVIVARCTDGVKILKAGRPVYQRFYIKNSESDQLKFTLRKFWDQIQCWHRVVQDDTLFINAPNSGHDNGSKILHYRLLKLDGFLVPEATFTNSADRQYLSEKIAPQLVVKGNSSFRTQAQLLSPGEFYTAATQLEWPHLFQQYIQGEEIRCHFVGASCVSVRIKSSAIDYRYPRNDEIVEFNRCVLPAEQSRLCWLHMKRCGLEFAGFDFKVADDGKMWLLERNTMPAFSFYDKKLGGELSSMLIDYLNGGISHHAKKLTSRLIQNAQIRDLNPID